MESWGTCSRAGLGDGQAQRNGSIEAYNPIGIGQFVASEGGGAQAHSAGSCQRTIPDRNQAQILAIVPVEAGPDRLELFPGI